MGKTILPLTYALQDSVGTKEGIDILAKNLKALLPCTDDMGFDVSLIVSLNVLGQRIMKNQHWDQKDKLD